MSTAPSSSRDDGTLIQIDTLGDWERIQNNFSDAIERALDAQLGPTASGAVRDALRQHLIHWRNKTFEVAKANVRVNGVEADEATGEEEMEPFDEVLNHQVWALEEERLAWEATISEYRRNGPKDLRHLTEGILVHEQGTEYQSDAKPPENAEIDFDVEPVLDNLEEIAETHRRVMEQGKRILETAPALSERAERAPVILQELEKLA